MDWNATTDVWWPVTSGVTNWLRVCVKLSTHFKYNYMLYLVYANNHIKNKIFHIYSSSYIRLTKGWQRGTYALCSTRGVLRWAWGWEWRRRETLWMGYDIGGAFPPFWGRVGAASPHFLLLGHLPIFNFGGLEMRIFVQSSVLLMSMRYTKKF